MFEEKQIGTLEKNKTFICKMTYNFLVNNLILSFTKYEIKRPKHLKL